MEYSIRELADLAGISTRTLRYYDEINLLKPNRVNENGVRFYGKKNWICCSRFYSTENRT